MQSKEGLLALVSCDGLSLTDIEVFDPSIVLTCDQGTVVKNALEFSVAAGATNCEFTLSSFRLEEGGSLYLNNSGNLFDDGSNNSLKMEITQSLPLTLSAGASNLGRFTLTENIVGAVVTVNQDIANVIINGELEAAPAIRLASVSTDLGDIVYRFECSEGPILNAGNIATAACPNAKSATNNFVNNMRVNMTNLSSPVAADVQSFASLASAHQANESPVATAGNSFALYPAGADNGGFSYKIARTDIVNGLEVAPLELLQRLSIRLLNAESFVSALINTADNDEPTGLGLQCTMGAWNSPATSCSGNIIASGIMPGDYPINDQPETAGAECAKAAAASGQGSCCMYHLYGQGTWYLTDGVKQDGGRLCAGGSSCYSGGDCL